MSCFDLIFEQLIKIWLCRIRHCKSFFYFLFLVARLGCYQNRRFIRNHVSTVVTRKTSNPNSRCRKKEKYQFRHIHPICHVSLLVAQHDDVCLIISVTGLSGTVSNPKIRRFHWNKRPNGNAEFPIVLTFF